MVVAGVAAAALGALQRGLGHALADQQHVAQVDGQMPAGVELPVALHVHMLEALPQLAQLDQCLGDLVGVADDADQRVHRVLQVEVQRVRVLGFVAVRRAVERRQRQFGGLGDGLVGHLWPICQRPDVVGCAERGTAAEHQQVRKRIAAQPVRAVHAA